MALLQDPDRFSLPVAAFIRQLMKERFPQFPTGQGSAFGDLLIVPSQFLFQKWRDELNTIKRNMSIQYYQTMLEEEMDRLAANYFVERREGTRSYGVVRVFYEEAQNVSIDQNAVFFDDSNHRWHPIVSVSVAATDVAANYVSDTGEYFVDVAVIAEATGEDYAAEAEQVNQFSGILGAVRCVNLNRFSSGKADDTNTDLVMAIKDSVTNNELVKAQAIRKVLREAFVSIRSMQVVGFGHSAMERDAVEAVVSFERLIQLSFCRKYNLPLDADGNVNFYDQYGNVVISPIGGVVGAITDNTGIDFNSVSVSLDSQSTRIVSLQPGYRIRLFPATGVVNDLDEGEYFVTRIEEVSVEPNGVPVKVARLDRPFKDPALGSYDPVLDAEKYSYTIMGPVATNSFHVGGKVDVYVDSSANSEEVVIVAAVPETEVGSGVAEIPITEEVPTPSTLGIPLFENNQGFLLPFMGIVKIEQIASDNDQAIERELIAGEHYVFISAESRRRFTTQENDVIRIIGRESDGTPMFIGKRLKITYITNKDIPLMQEYVDDPQRKSEGTDIKILPTEQIFVDIFLKYRGTLTQSQVSSALKELILSKGAGSTLTVQEICLLLGVFGITDIEHPVLITMQRQTGTGQVTVRNSEDRLSVEDFQSLYPVDELSVEKLS